MSVRRWDKVWPISHIRKAVATELPPDAVLVREIGSWNVYFSKSRQSLFVNTADYHPEPLILSENVLCELSFTEYGGFTETAEYVPY